MGSEDECQALLDSAAHWLTQRRRGLTCLEVVLGSDTCVQSESVLSFLRGFLPSLCAWDIELGFSIKMSPYTGGEERREREPGEERPCV